MFKFNFAQISQKRKIKAPKNIYNVQNYQLEFLVIKFYTQVQHFFQAILANDFDLD